MKKIVYVSLESLLAIHESMIDEYGGSHGIRDLTLLHSALARAQASFNGEELYPSIWEKAAALFHSLLFNHGFIDGNKRTAITTTTRFLAINGCTLEVSSEEFVTFPLKMEGERLSIEEIAKWLKIHNLASNERASSG